MARITQNLMGLLLFSLITTGVQVSDPQLFADWGYEVSFPCEEDLVCFHTWRSNANERTDYIAVVTNGKIQKGTSTNSRCSLPVKNDHLCPKSQAAFSNHNTIPEINLTPGKTVSLQCVLLEQGRCGGQQVSLTWVDEAGAEVQQESYQQLTRDSACDTTLTVTVQSPGLKKFKCQMTVNQLFGAAVALWLRVSAFRGRGRGLIVDPEPEEKVSEAGAKQDVVGTAAGTVGSVVLIALVAAVVVNRRRAGNRLSGECYAASNIPVANADDVIYADVVLPDSSGRVSVFENTEYACIRSE